MTSRTLLSLAIAALLPLAACKPTAEPAQPSAVDATAEAAHDTAAHEAPSKDEHAAHGAAVESHDLPAVPAQRWATDAPLREGMQGIAEAVAQAQAAKAAGTFGAEQANALAARVEDRFQFMLANCKLEPEADVALHSLLAQFVASAKELQADPQADAALAHMDELLALYPKYFDHAGWNPQAAHG